MRKIMFFVMGVMFGVMVGALIALLITPKSGEAMRDDARKRFDEMLDEARTAADAKQKQLETELSGMTTPTPTKA